MLGSRIILFKSITIVLLLLIPFPTSLEAIRTTKQHVKNKNFIQTNGIHFVLNDKPLYLNGFNSYWLMYMATDPSTTEKVSSVFQQASMHGMNVARTWAFNDGCYRALQSSPGVYDEDTFKGLDFVVSEAGKYGVHLILSLVNSLKEYGGRKQYVQWARDRGQYIKDEDEFFTSNITKIFFKNHIKAVLTRVNSISGITYKDDPTIFAWELMNEPRCQSDLSGRVLQKWIAEMAAYVKSIDKNHLLEVGLEGFYGESKKQYNPGYQLFGTDFISNNQIPQVDFSTSHLYPDQWLSGSNDHAQLEFVNKWIGSHIQDSKTLLNKPLLITEFGKSLRSTSGHHVAAARDVYLEKIYDMVYKCARGGGPCGGATFWHLMAQGMENFSDGYEVVLEQYPSTTALITRQSRRMSRLTNFGTIFYKFLGLFFE